MSDTFLFVAAEVTKKGSKTPSQEFFCFFGGPPEMKDELKIYKSQGAKVAVKFKCWMRDGRRTFLVAK